MAKDPRVAVGRCHRRPTGPWPPDTASAGTGGSCSWSSRMTSTSCLASSWAQATPANPPPTMSTVVVSLTRHRLSQNAFGAVGRSLAIVQPAASNWASPRAGDAWNRRIGQARIVPDRLLLATSPTEGSASEVATTLSVLTGIVFVNPVPSAQAQLAFTLGFHIIFVPRGVSWAFMTLIATIEADAHNDRSALILAQRWSKFMAVTFAVGAVTGTVLSFEFGYPGPISWASGATCSACRSASRACSSSPQLSTPPSSAGVACGRGPTSGPAYPIVIGRHGGEHLGRRRERLDERADRVHPRLERKRRRRRSHRGDLQHRPCRGRRHTWWLRRTWSAASWSPRCTRWACCEAGGIAITTLASSSLSPSAQSPRRSSWASAMGSLVGSIKNQPVKFAAIELLPNTESDAPETLLGHLERQLHRQRRPPYPRSGLLAL